MESSRRPAPSCGSSNIPDAVRSPTRAEPDAANFTFDKESQAASTRYADEKNCRYEQLRLARTQNWIVGIGTGTSLLALAGLMWGLIYSGRGTKAAINQAETARQEFESSQRPWISLSAETSAIQWGPKNAIVVSIGTLTNLGHSVATRVSYHPFLVQVGKNFRGDECKSEAEAYHKDPHKSKNDGIVLFPNQAAKLRWPTITEIAPGPDFDLFLIGCVVYDSPTDDQAHFTEVQYRVLPPNGNPFQFSATTQPAALYPDINGTQAQ